jgi:predicted heme/steroid binding protein
MASRMRAFTRDELRRYDGTNGRPALIAYKGKVYDVSGSFLWQEGRHQVLHSAGGDLTDAMADAPHGDELMERVRVVGVLVED